MKSLVSRGVESHVGPQGYPVKFPNDYFLVVHTEIKKFLFIQSNLAPATEPGHHHCINIMYILCMCVYVCVCVCACVPVFLDGCRFYPSRMIQKVSKIF